MAEHRFGNDSMFANWFLAKQAEGRARIGRAEVDAARSATEVDAQELAREYNLWAHRNRGIVLEEANRRGVTVEAYSAIAIEEARAEVAALAKGYEAHLEHFYAGRANEQQLQLEAGKARIEVEKTRQLGEAEVDKDRQREHVKLIGEAESTIQTLKVGDEANRAAFRSRMDTIDQCGEVEAKIWALKREPGMDGELRASQLRRLERQLALLEAQLEPPKDGSGAAQ